MNLLKSEKGNTLIIAIFVLVMGSVIGLTLMSLSMNGTKRNEHRENYSQAVEQAEKGIKHITLEIQKALENKIPEPIIANTTVISQRENSFISSFNTTLEKHLCSSGGHINELDGDLAYTVCIDDESFKNSKYNISKKLKIISTGTANEETRQLTSTYTIGAESLNYPSFMNYAVSTHNGGNLILNGGVEIKGNILADGNIIVSDYGYAPISDKETTKFHNINIDKFNNSPWKKTTFPEVNGLTEDEPATIVVNSDYKLFKMNNSEFKSGCSRSSSLTNVVDNLLEAVNLNIVKLSPNYFTYYDLVNYDFNNANTNIQCLFDISSTSQINNYLSNDENNRPVIKNSTVVEGIDTSEFVDAGESKVRSTVQSTSLQTKTYFLSNKSYNGNFIFKADILFGGILGLTNETLIKNTLNGNYYFDDKTSITLLNNNTLNGSYYFKNSSQTDISIPSGNSTLDGEFYLNRGAPRGLLGSLSGIVKGLLGGNLDSAIKISGGSHHMKGAYYIDGDVEINNATINADAVLYVNGNVVIKHSEINSLDNGKLIILAKGNIIYEYASELGANIGKDFINEGPPIELNAYFYADNKIELHGTLSNIHIKGGVAAKQILLSGVRGDIKKNKLGVLPKFINSDDPKEPSRLTIEYDEKVVTTIKELNDKYSGNKKYHEIFLQPAKEMKRELN